MSLFSRSYKKEFAFISQSLSLGLRHLNSGRGMRLGRAALSLGAYCISLRPRTLLCKFHLPSSPLSSCLSSHIVREEKLFVLEEEKTKHLIFFYNNLVSNAISGPES